jgi:hypothetical protein
MSSKCQVFISQGQRRISVKCQKDDVLIKHFRTVPKFFFDFKEKEWTFPSTCLASMCEFLESGGYAVELLDQRLSQPIRQENGKLMMTLRTHIDSFEQLKQLKGFQYDKVERTVECEATELAMLQDILIKEGVLFHLDESMVEPETIEQ